MSKRYEDFDADSDRLSYDELEKITGGIVQSAQYMNISCPKCGKVFKINVMLNVVKCPSCQSEMELKG